MLAQPSPSSSAPPYAIPCWMDGQNLYFELRGPKGEPYILTFRQHELSKALELLFTTWATLSVEPFRRPLNTIPMTKDGLSEAQREATRQVLKRLGVI